jgi:hypothetical protein
LIRIIIGGSSGLFGGATASQSERQKDKGETEKQWTELAMMNKSLLSTKVFKHRSPFLKLELEHESHQDCTRSPRLTDDALVR